ncbi:hypothetical protein STRIP9103_08040 [Streptomyces ipomoeae 91-03]|uniref:Aldehyde oxidase/xanthine dehydrogenase second molybdopterin binding domain-containing protein n=1 Tax=Streptomyces ipomoeae 91-03 TaxID=698759 RepID=L1L9S9_9ACTN|nr:hypothetical protein STRIP9103_08040 [Streptomyces ipomoeae 91-03]
MTDMPKLRTRLLVGGPRWRCLRCPRQGLIRREAYAAVFAEVAVDARLGLVRVRRMLGVYDAGRIVSWKLAGGQALGGLVGGIGQALLEHTVTDHRAENNWPEHAADGGRL